MTTAEGVNRLAAADSFDGAMYLVQAIEVIALAINSPHLGLDVRDGPRIAARLRHCQVGAVRGS